MGGFLPLEARRERRIPSRGSILVARFPNDDDPIRVTKRKRPQHYSIDRVEDRCIRTDPDRQRDHHYGQEAEAPAEPANAVLKIVK